MMQECVPSIPVMRDTQQRLSPYVIETPMVEFRSPYVDQFLDCDFVAKLELFQRTGTFKARGAINNMLALGAAGQRVTAVSAGNHAVAVAYAASVLGADAKVVMQASASPYRIELARSFGCEIVIAPDGPPAFARANEIVEKEARALIHPFEGYAVTEATGGIGLEMLQQDGALEAVIVAIGGGGLASGVAAAIKQLRPDCELYGVEPEGAAAMSESFKTGEVCYLDTIDSFVDSLSPPMTTPYALSVCRKFLDDIVTVSDAQIAAAALLLFKDLKLAVEAAGAAALAGAIGPLRNKLAGKRIGIIVCGANIDRQGFSQLLELGESSLRADIFNIK